MTNPALRLSIKDTEIGKFVIKALDEEFLRLNQNHKQVKSPAQQFDESHKKWLENGREC